MTHHPLHHQTTYSLPILILKYSTSLSSFYSLDSFTIYAYVFVVSLIVITVFVLMFISSTLRQQLVIIEEKSLPIKLISLCYKLNFVALIIAICISNNPTEYI